MTDNREIHRGVSLADPDSLLGMLQRGRGRGYLEALKAPPETVWPLLFECITNDPRLYPFFECREEYYAALIVATGMSLEPLRIFLEQHDHGGCTSDRRFKLVLYTLIHLAEEYENTEALRVLHGYVSYGAQWSLVVDSLGEMETPEALAGVVRVLCDRVQTDSQVRAQFKKTVEDNWEYYCWREEEDRADAEFFLPVCEPWRTICESNRQLAALFADVGIDYDRPDPPRRCHTPSEEYMAGLTLEGLFDQANPGNRASFRRILPEKVSIEHEDYLLQEVASDDWCHIILAFRGLGALGTPKAFEAIKRYIQNSEDADEKVRRYAFLAMAEMPGALSRHRSAVVPP